MPPGRRCRSPSSPGRTTASWAPPASATSSTGAGARNTAPAPPGSRTNGRIGYTWLAHDAQRTGVNREAKLLLLDVAFDRWRLHRVTFRTDARNERSRRALERLGAHLDGVLRQAQAGYDGAVRDNAVYSVLAQEWPQLRERLTSLVRTR
ncbi:GNAT family N-acetyltransferase [Streptomyces sp. MBT53]|uniref:GNAT family N-acetyltransferase n=1 Tax=Streptomyces sp. MBT53 TaxID=1488384 RepID=UPI001912987C|nr:GNAT family protein [Streptomyces sp. MBT53]MBK6015408.1 GNAT family N-acetyltransferase [Streptomyces sp. MBT53]